MRRTDAGTGHGLTVARNLLILALYLPQLLHAQIDIGTVKGTVSDPSNARVARARVSLENPLSGRKSQRLADDQGVFEFDNVPYGSYLLRIDASGFQPYAHEISVRSNVPAQVVVTLEVISARESVTVRAPTNLVQKDISRSETAIDEKSIELAPAVLTRNRLQAVVATTPGWSTENDGLMHIRGVDDGALYVVDGIPTPDRLDGFSASSLDTETISSVNVITGNIPAEFGDRTGAVVVVQPKSGLDTPLTGTLSVGAGSVRSGELSTTVAGGTRRWGFFLSGSGNRSDRFLDPVDPRNFNNQGGAASLSLRTDWHPTTDDTILVGGSVEGTDFRVPNNLIQELAGQRQRQELRDNRQSVSWQHIWSANTLTNSAYFRSFYGSRLFGSSFDVPLFADQNRHHTRQGFIASMTHSTHGHTIKLGAEVARVSVNEVFSFAVTDQQAAQEAGLTPAAMAFTPASPFLFADHVTRGAESAYVQDDFSPLPNLTINAGLRFDHSNLLASDQQVSPRIGAAYYLTRTKTVLRASFNRLYMPPQVENLLLASSEQARALSPFATQAGGGGAAIFPEKASAFEVGLVQQLARILRLNVAYWWRTFRNIDDPNVLFGTTIIFPNSVAEARAKGIDVRLDVPERRGWSGHLSYSNSRITETGPLNGGLFLTQDFMDIGPGTEFVPDHDQRNVGSFAVTYTGQHHGLWASFSGKYESGVPIEVEEAELDKLRTAPGAELVNFATQRVKPWAVFGWSGGMDLVRRERMTMSAQLDVQNVANHPFVYNFGNPFSGTHFGYPRLFAGRLKFTFH
jgi:hypothetical protein